MDYLIFGLGNPGVQYEQTRHNVGRLAVEHFVAAHDDAAFRPWHHDARMRARVSSGALGKQRVLCIIPETYMNRSGASAAAARVQYTNANTLVVHDDLDVALGTLKISHNRSAGGHNGVRSVIDALGTQEFTRVRIGIAPTGETGTLRKPKNPEQFVLQALSADERERVRHVLGHASEALEEIIVNGKEAAMNRFN